MRDLQAALDRLRDQAAEDYAKPWKPGLKRTDAELLWRYITKLKDDLSLARDDAFLRGYEDRMGGSYSQSELEALERGKQGIFG